LDGCRFFLSAVGKAGPQTAKSIARSFPNLKSTNFFLERKASAKQQVSSRFTLIRFAASFLVAVG
jgi:hypothetical protein